MYVCWELIGTPLIHLQMLLDSEVLHMVKDLDLFCSTKFSVLEMNRTYLTVLEMTLECTTVSMIKMLGSHAQHVSHRSLLIIVQSFMASYASVHVCRGSLFMLESGY